MKPAKKPPRTAGLPPLEGASSWRSFKGVLKKAPAAKRRTRTRRVAPDKGELSPS